MSVKILLDTYDCARCPAHYYADYTQDIVRSGIITKQTKSAILLLR